MSLRQTLARTLNVVTRPLGLRVIPAGSGIEDNAWHDQRRLVPDAGTIVDAGANVGQSVRSYRAIYPNAHIHSFEPFPESFEKLAEVCRADGKATPHPYALAEAEGTLSLHVNNQSSQNSLYPLVQNVREVSPLNEMTTLGTVDVHVTTLDHWAKEQGIPQIDVVKADVQGAELRLFQGAAGLLARGAIRLIYTETAFDDTYDGGADFADVRAFLAGHGYSLYGLYYLRQNRGSMLQFCDAIYVSPALKAAVRAHPDRYFLHY